MKPAPAIVFVGPTLARQEVEKRLSCQVWPPAARGDVWRALLQQPSVIVLLDGVFEAQPSLWHRELLAALSAGVTVFGAASMGALRAVELAPHGMIGVGEIYRAYRDGEWVDDAEVALLHASREHGYRPLTVPLVNVRHAARLAQRAGVLSGREAGALENAGERTFYQARFWPGVLDLAERRWRRGTRARWEQWAARGLEDLKAKDAVACLDAAQAFLRGSPQGLPGGEVKPSSSARRLRLMQRLPALARFQRSPEGKRLEEAGMRRLLLAGWARTLGMAASPAETRAAEAAWLAAHHVRGPSLRPFLASLGMDVLDARRLFEDIALETRVLASASRLLPDGPSSLEAVATELQHRGRRLR